MSAALYWEGGDAPNEPPPAPVARDDGSLDPAWAEGPAALVPSLVPPGTRARYHWQPWIGAASCVGVALRTDYNSAWIRCEVHGYDHYVRDRQCAAVEPLGPP